MGRAQAKPIMPPQQKVMGFASLYPSYGAARPARSVANSTRRANHTDRVKSQNQKYFALPEFGFTV
jgi:hypothetical protein